MAFQSSGKTYALTTSTTSANMALPFLGTGFSGASVARYLITNPGTVVQYYAALGDSTQTLTAPSPVASGNAVETMGTPILPGQQILVNHNINGTTPYFYGLCSSGTSVLYVTSGSGD